MTGGGPDEAPPPGHQNGSMATPEDDHGWGIAPGYHDVWGAWKTPSPEAAAALRRAMGAQTDDPAEPAPSGTPLRIVRPGEAASAGTTGPSTVFLEDGTQVPLHAGVIPPDLPLGYHRLVDSNTGYETALIVVPPSVYRPDRLRTWGWAAQNP